MFEVLWTDPNRELLKERMVKKDQEGKTKRNASKRSQSDRLSMSTNSSSASERGFGLFMHKSRKPHRTSSKTEKSAPPSEASADEYAKDKHNSTYDVKSLLSHPDGSETTMKPRTGLFQPAQLSEVGDAASTTSSRDSMLSKCTQPSAATTSTWASGTYLRGSSISDSTAATKPEYLFQSLGPSSFITRTTEVTATPRTPDKDIDDLISEIHISADGPKAATPSASESAEVGSTSGDNTQDSDIDIFGRTPMTIGDTPFLMPPSHLPQLPRTPPQTNNRDNALVHKANWREDDRVDALDAWKPPHEWECTPTKRGQSVSPRDRLQGSPESADLDHYMSPDIVALQREVRMMAMASQELILANIKAGMGNAPDTMIYKELEMTKKRWIFSALHQSGSYVNLDELTSISIGRSSSHTPRVLALYESQASASFLAALYPQLELSHLSQNPISPNLFPNVQPILVPSVSASAAFRPLPPQVFTAITCLSMPALFPSTDIPPFLRQINRCLVPGGALYLTVIDPQPVPSTMGPLLREWLFDKLLINLEKMFRTTYPSRTFPDWLEYGRLRGKGSNIFTAQAPAVTEHVILPGGTKESPTVKTELNSLVIRTLWQEVWGSFVRADCWWWDEEAIVKECVEYGTSWEFSHIVAHKG